MLKRILVTGGCGFIGSNFIRYILDRYPEYKIVNLDKLTYAGNIKNLKDIQDNPHYRFVKGDICDVDIVKGLVKDSDIIVNFAAQTHVDRSIVAADDFLETNVHGTYALLEAARECKIQRFVHIGTDEVYGSREAGFFKESDPLNPSNPYSASKASADLLVLSFHHTYKLPVIITRSSNNFGPYQFPEKIIPLFITNLLEDKKIPLYGDGLNIRDWLFVLDNVRAIALLMHRGQVGQIYNIAAGNLLTNLELTHTILKMMHKDVSSIEKVNDRPGHDRRYGLDFSKLRNLGWQPEYRFEDALRETINWYKENTSWWKPFKDEENSGHWLQWDARQSSLPGLEK
jgi:dTDP-glucose 4,6-dehydratase